MMRGSLRRWLIELNKTRWQRLQLFQWQDLPPGTARAVCGMSRTFDREIRRVSTRVLSSGKHALAGPFRGVARSRGECA